MTKNRWIGKKNSIFTNMWPQFCKAQMSLSYKSQMKEYFSTTSDIAKGCEENHFQKSQTV